MESLNWNIIWKDQMLQIPLQEVSAFKQADATRRRRLEEEPQVAYCIPLRSVNYISWWNMWEKRNVHILFDLLEIE